MPKRSESNEVVERRKDTPLDVCRDPLTGFLLEVS